MVEQHKPNQAGKKDEEIEADDVAQALVDDADTTEESDDAQKE